MSPTTQTISATQFNRAERLKNKLVRFATGGPLQEEFELQRKLFFEAATPEDEHDTESVLDWFLFDWYDENGDGVIAYYLDHNLDLASVEREILFDWQDSINSVFEIKSISKGLAELKDLDTGDPYAVRSRSNELPFSRGQFIVGRLLPLGNELIFSGLQFLMPDREAALAWLEMRRAVNVFENPEAIEKARREQVAAFSELFGCDELTVASSKLGATLQRFEKYLLAERRDPESGMTAAEKFRKELGQELSIPSLPAVPAPLASAGEVTILCDDFDGIVLLPDYNRFRRVFETDEPDRHSPDWKDLVWSYIKDPDIPTVAFERVAEQNPAHVERIIRALVGDTNFSIEHLYAVLLHYKNPVDGLDDLRDDQELWDLFDGGNSADAKPKNQTQRKKAAKSSSKKKSGRAGRPAPSRSNAKATGSSNSKRKLTASKSNKRKSGASKKGSGVKSAKRMPSSRTKPASRKSSKKRR